MALEPNGMEWQSKSGLPDDTTNSPQGYARRLVRYIKDASTVRVRVLDRWGSSPSKEEIIKMRREWERENEWKPSQERLRANNTDDFVVTPVEPVKKVKIPNIRDVKEVSGGSKVFEAKAIRLLGCSLIYSESPGKQDDAAAVHGLVLASMVSFGLSKAEAGRIYGGYLRGTTTKKIRVFFDDCMADDMVKSAWIEMASDDFKNVFDYQTFKEMTE